MAFPPVASIHRSASAGAMRFFDVPSANASTALPEAASNKLLTTMPWTPGSAPVEMVACATPVAVGR